MPTQFTTTQDRLKFLFSMLLKHVGIVLPVLILEIIMGLLNALIPYFTKLQIDQLGSQSTSWLFVHGSSPLVLFGLLLLIPLTIELIRFIFFDFLIRKNRQTLDGELQLDTEEFIWSKLSTLDAGFFENRRNTRILRSTIASTTVTSEFFRFLRDRLNDFTTIAAILPLLGFISWQMLLFVAVVTLGQTLVNEMSRKQEAAQSMLREKSREDYWKYESVLTDHFQTLRIMGATQRFISAYQEATRKRRHEELMQERSSLTINTLEWFLRNGLTFVASLFVGWQVMKGQVSLGTFTLVVSYTLQLNTMFRGLLETTKIWSELNLQMDRLAFFMMLRPRVKSLLNPISPIPEIQSLAFEGVHFAYPDLSDEEKNYVQMMLARTEKFINRFSWFYSYYKTEFDEWQSLFSEPYTPLEVVRGVNLRLERGKVTALLGRNGAGKTTITHLLMHHYDPTQGKVVLNDQELSAYDQSELFLQFAIIQQTPFILWQFSIRDNLMLGVRREVSDEEIWTLLEKMDVRDVIEKLPKKLDTILGEGVNLSGGQQQLIAVARVLLQQRPLIIFDEGMNQMDIEHETKVLELLRIEKKRAAILFITHRITTARKADEIYILDQGKIAEQGTHTQLQEKNGLYANFWKLQVVE